MPDALKVSRVTPIDKGGDAADPSNYCPISHFTRLRKSLRS